MEEKLFVFTSNSGDYIGTAIIRAYDQGQAKDIFKEKFPLAYENFDFNTSIRVHNSERLVFMFSISYGEP